MRSDSAAVIAAGVRVSEVSDGNESVWMSESEPVVLSSATYPSPAPGHRVADGRGGVAEVRARVKTLPQADQSVVPR
jgi:hypothetical protein